MSTFYRFWKDLEYRDGRSQPRQLYPLQQRGGGRSRLYVKDHPITILETADHNTIIAYGGRFSPVRPCFKLELNPTTHHAILQDVVRPRSVTAESCFDDGHHDSSDVVRATYMLAQARGMRTMEYTDNSSKHCSATSEERLHLADYYTLLVGRTWYETIFLDAGAVSVTIRGMRTPAQLLEDRRNAAEVSWDTMRGVTHNDAHLPVDIDTAAPGSARRVLQYLRSLNRPDICEYLGANLSEFLGNSRVKAIHGSRWLCVIPARGKTSEKRITRRASSGRRNNRRSTLRRSAKNIQNLLTT